MNPLLLLDIDGVLNPWAAQECPAGYVEHRWRRRRAWLRPEHGPVLRELAERIGGELAWATSWAQDANTLVGAALGLPLAWLDDDFELRPAAKERFLARREPPTLLVPIDPAVGMAGDELATVELFMKKT